MTLFYFYLTNFVILDMDEDVRVHLIIVRPFLKIRRENINLESSEIMLVFLND